MGGLPGEHFLHQFSDDLRNEFPGMQGFSVSNLKRIRIFANDYPIGSQAVNQLPWGHIFELIHTVKDRSAREWYVHQTLKNGWSRSILEMQIETQLYERQGKPGSKLSNFHDRDPALQIQQQNHC